MKDYTCLNCKHFNFSDWGTCEAFPDGIPHIITIGEHDHKKPYKGDNGIRFEPIK